MTCHIINKTLSDLFECAIINEMKAADIFASFRDAYSFNEDLKEFWEGMHKDEIMHAEVLRKIHNDLPADRLSEKPDDNICQYAESAYNLILKISEEKPENLNEAYELAHELEFCELNEVYKLLLENKVDDEKAKSFIIEEIKNHQNKMVEFSSKLGDKEWRKSIKPLES